jgi:hypothetical protein
MDDWKNFILGVRQTKAQLLEQYGGVSGLQKHQEEERARLEQEGWKFITAEELKMMKHNRCYKPRNDDRSNVIASGPLVRAGEVIP